MTQKPLDYELDKKLKQICGREGVPGELIEELLEAERQILLRERKISHKDTLEHIIKKYI